MTFGNGLKVVQIDAGDFSLRKEELFSVVGDFANGVEDFLVLKVRGVMGYEGHLMHDPNVRRRTEKTQESMELLILAHEAVGGDVISGGGTGTWECNQAVTELQAGSYVLMDGDYSKLDLPFKEGLLLLTTVISTSKAGYAVYKRTGKTNR